MSARTDTEAAEAQASSGVTPDILKDKLIEHLGATHVEIEDMSGTAPPRVLLWNVPRGLTVV